MVTGLRIERVEPDTPVDDGIAVILLPAHALGHPISGLDLAPWISTPGSAFRILRLSAWVNALLGHFLLRPNISATAWPEDSRR
jgi:hypothetical protein